MTEIIRETVTTQETLVSPKVHPSNIREATSMQTFEYLIYFLFGILDVLLVFRLVLKLLGANANSSLVSLTYQFTGIFIMPFEGIFRRGFTQGLETTSILEPATIVAIIIYAILAWGIVKLVRIMSGERQVN